MTIFQCSTRTPFTVLLLLSCFLFIPKSTVANDIVTIPAVGSAEKHQTHKIVVANFNPKSTKQLKAGYFSDIIYRDLKISFVFDSLPKSRNKFIEQQTKADWKKGKPSFKEWKVLGAEFLLWSSYTIEGDQLDITTELYDTATGTRIFGRRLRNSIGQRRLEAHRISDIIFKQITHVNGIARTKLAFIHNYEQNRKIKEVFVMDADGVGVKRLTQDKNLAATPCWGKNGAEIYYTSYKDFNPDLCLIPLKGGPSVFISRRAGFNISPFWNDKANKLVLTLSKDNNSEIYTMDRNGKNAKRLTRHKKIDSSPSWFLNGRQILFTSDRMGRPQIFSMDSDGLNQKRLTFQGTYNDSAALSPKGDKIAFASRVKGRFNIFLMDTDGRNWQQLTGTNGDEGNNEDPTWAPNGEVLAFTSDRTGKQQIYVVSKQGGKPIQLTSKGINNSPAWSPYLFKD